MSKLYRDFVDQGPFTVRDLVEIYKGKNTEKTLRNYLYRGLERDEVRKIRGGLYYVQPMGSSGKDYWPDPFLTASKLCEDCVIAYHGALALHGAAYSDSRKIHFYSQTMTRSFQFKTISYIPVQKKIAWGFETLRREGHRLKVTDRERTVLDCIDRVDYAGGFEEMMKSIELFPSVDAGRLQLYLKKYGKQSLAAKTGFVLEQLKDHWHLADDLFARLERGLAGATYYFQPGIKKGRRVARWHLVVPSQFEDLMRAV